MTEHRRPTTPALPPGAHASRQWEAELLVSGIAVFAMLQLPGLLDDAIFALRPRFDAGWTSLLVLLYVYGKGAAVLLAATFTIHLLLRARWVALAGMHAIYPRGVDWDRLRVGPIAREEEQARLGRIEDVVARADHRATILFTIGVMLASVLVALFVLVALCLGLPMLLLDRIGVRLDPGVVMLSLMVLMVPFFIAHMVDMKHGATLAPGGRGDRLIRGTYALFRRVGMSTASNPALALINSHLGQQRMMAATMAIIMASTIGVIGAYIVMRSDTPLGSYALFPHLADDDRRAAAALYDDQRDAARDRATPYIASAIVDGPYLRLVVPFEPERDAIAMARACPAGAAGADAGGDDAGARLACLSRLHPLAIDGAPVAADYQVTTDPRTRRPALLAMLDVRALAPGRHVLEVGRPPRHDRDGKPREGDRDPAVRIPFWR